MSTQMNFTVASTMNVPTATISRVESKLLTNCNKCEGNINVGLFCDRTNDNRKFDKPNLQHGRQRLPSLLDGPDFGACRFGLLKPLGELDVRAEAIGPMRAHVARAKAPVTTQQAALTARGITVLKGDRQ